MKVRICCYEKHWIFGKFSTRLYEHVTALGITCVIGDSPKISVEVNHHVGGLGYDGRTGTVNTLMITHMDHPSRIRDLRRLLETANMGICMSHSTMNLLLVEGLPAEKLCVINPAHDGVIRPRPFNVGIMSRVYRDGRKREPMLLELARRISSVDFRFTIMGAGWDAIVKELKSLKFDVQYFPEFDLKRYNILIPELDYYLYFGTDEGSMGFLDACAAGVKTIVTPQGYHLDAMDGITHGFKEMPELVAIFNEIARERRKAIDSVSEWTWANYARKHIDVWTHCLNG